MTAARGVPMLRKLGKLAPKHDRRTLAFRQLLDRELVPAPPFRRDWTEPLGSQLPMFGNDVIGDCTCAAVAHMCRVWSANATGAPVAIPDEIVVNAYRQVSGFDPADPLTDRGAAMLDVLKLWRTTGIGGHKIGAFAQIVPEDIVGIQTAINMFGGVYVGMSLPKSAQAGEWIGTGNGADDLPGSWGGHCAGAATYDRTSLTFMTWGHRQPASWYWVGRYVDECYVLIGEDWVTGARPAPSGFSIERLRNALALL